MVTLREGAIAVPDNRLVKLMTFAVGQVGSFDFDGHRLPIALPQPTLQLDGRLGYGNFEDGSRTDMLDTKGREACAQCHLARKDQGYVFTEYRER